jgi:hypothetical protein
MTLTANNLETLINMLNALAQRHETVRQLAGQLHGGVIWRSMDGQLTVALTAGQRTELEAFVKGYLDESDVLIAAIRAALAKPPPEADQPLADAGDQEGGLP